MEQLHINAKEVKKIAMKSLKRSLSEVLPVSLEEHILENILGHIDLLASGSWKLEIFLYPHFSRVYSLYRLLSQIYNMMRNGLFHYHLLTLGLIDQLQEILAEIKREDSIGEETTEETMEEGEGGEIMGGYEVGVEDGDFNSSD